MDANLADRADEAAHQAVLESIKANPLSGPALMGHNVGERVADNLIDLHKKLAAYYRSLDEE